MTGWQVPGESFSGPVTVLGPSTVDRVPARDADHAARIARTMPSRGLVGTADIVGALVDRVYGADVAIRMADEGRDDPGGFVTAEDIEIPPAAGADPVERRHPAMAPFEVSRDENVVVTATLVDHGVCFPAFGFRFDTAYGSVVVSGDTTTSSNLIRLAEGADLLLHEVIDLEAILATFPESPERQGIARHLAESHTPYAEVGGIARAARVSQLVLHHIVPNTRGSFDARKVTRAVADDFGGPVSVARDGDVFAVRSQSAIDTRRDMEVTA
ncbi:MBL fold metallo-hydrolase [Tomitella fengzijianii]|uniref:MBL fold metallo-hydrolase n=1 Tax=Tomitella fengzijianii TaxID=2597660 RepID=UPI00131D8BA2|nr:MBL fold metallo-hydrolase [Tomitella fengzijianii]